MWGAESGGDGWAGADRCVISPVHGAGHDPLSRRSGTDTFEMLPALERWVEKGEAPQRIEASRVVNGVVQRTRPLCPYPQIAGPPDGGAATRRRISAVLCLRRIPQPVDSGVSAGHGLDTTGFAR